MLILLKIHSSSLSKNPAIFAFAFFVYSFCCNFSCTSSYPMSLTSLGSILMASVMSYIALSKSYLFW